MAHDVEPGAPPAGSTPPTYSRTPRHARPQKSPLTPTEKVEAERPQKSPLTPTEKVEAELFFDAVLDQGGAILRARRVPEHLVEDLLQEVVRGMLNRWRKLDPDFEQRRRYWLVAVSNEVKGHYRRQRKESTAVLEVRQTGADPFEAVYEKQQLQQLLELLTEGQAAAFWLALQGLTGPEMAEILGTTPGNARQAKFAAERRLRRKSDQVLKILDQGPPRGPERSR
jgi:RNA polymerase sigma factor (sigma-70 family)